MARIFVTTLNMKDVKCMVIHCLSCKKDLAFILTKNNINLGLIHELVWRIHKKKQRITGKKGFITYTNFCR